MQFFSNRLSPQPSAEARPPMDEQCLLFICTDEEGDSSFHRCQKMAGEWRNSPSRKFIQILPRNVQNEQQGRGIITYPVSSKKHNASIGAAVLNAEWNQLLTLVLATHRPKYIIFDGPFPYAGMIANMKTRKDSQWYWLRVDGIEDRSATERAHLFDKVLEFSFESPSAYRLLEPGDTQLRKDPPSVVLDGTRYTGASSPQVNLHALLKSFDPPLELVEFTSARASTINQRFGHPLSTIHGFLWSSHSSTVIRTHRYSPCCKPPRGLFDSSGDQARCAPQNTKGNRTLLCDVCEC